MSSNRDLECRLTEGIGRARFRGLVRRWDLGQHSPAVAGHLLARAGTDVVVVDTATAPGMALATAIALDHPHMTSIAVARSSNQVRLEATRVGVHAVVAPDSPPSDFCDAFDRAVSSAERRRASAAHLPTGRIIAVLSACGGCGRTLVATNLAVGLARVAAHPVAFAPVDHPQRSVAGIRALSIENDYVVVDTTAGFSASSVAAAEAATDLVVVATLEADTGRSEQLLLRALDRLGTINARRFLVLNRLRAGVAVDLDRVCETFGVAVAAVLPDAGDSLPPEACTAGRPSGPGSLLASTLVDLVKLVADVPALIDQRPRFWRSAS